MISIIVPTLNEEKILRQSLSELKKLSSVDFELIVSDGGSTDKTLAIAKELADTVVENISGQRQTIALGRNLGAQKARGEFLVFVDADVFIPHINDFFIQALKQFSADSKLTGLTVFLKVLPEHVTLSDRLFFWFINRFLQFSNNFLHSGAASGEFQMIRKSAFESLGGYNEKLVMGEDNDMFSRLSRIGQTKVETGLFVMHTSRRAHHSGWAKLLFLWWTNSLHNKIWKKSLSREWKVVR